MVVFHVHWLADCWQPRRGGLRCRIIMELLATITKNRRTIVLTIVVNAPSAMADNDLRVICCAAKGDRDVFKVKASVDNDVVDLKMLVFEMGKHNMFRNIDPPKLILWQVSVLL
jgi:Crinkler effector protein N-terminal domain